MKKSDLLDITLRIFGVYFLVIVLTDLKTLILMFGSGYFSNPWMSYEEYSRFSIIWPYILNMIVDFIIMFFFLIKPQTIRVRILGAKRDSEIDLRIDKRSLLQLAIIVIGGLLITSSIASAGQYLITMVQNSKLHFANQPDVVPGFIWELFLAVTGYACITASGAIARYLTRNDKVAEESAPPTISPRAQWRIPPVKWHRRRPFKHRKKS